MEEKETGTKIITFRFKSMHITEKSTEIIDSVNRSTRLTYVLGAYIDCTIIYLSDMQCNVQFLRITFFVEEVISLVLRNLEKRC